MILKRLEEIFNTTKADLFVLKGFSVSIIERIGKNFPILDSNIYKDKKILLDSINATELLQAICSLSQPSVCSCESLIKLSTSFNTLDILGKKIIVIENNLLDFYPNPTTIDLPENDSDEFEDIDAQNNECASFYSYVISKDGQKFVQYIENYRTSNTCLSVIPLIAPSIITYIDGDVPEDAVPLTNSQLIKILTDCSVNGQFNIPSSIVVDKKDIDEKKLQIFNAIGELCNKSVSIYRSEQNERVIPRQELFAILDEVWGYKSFRNIQIYRDLTEDRSIREISQAEIIETVVRECENAIELNDENSVNNVLLTAPTGAGKSILFQLAAIYMAKKYSSLTIVVSPLVALMDDQVEGLTGYEGVATLNSNRSASEKTRILSEVKEGKIDILYLSPELLLSYTITNFIGERRLGLVVIDEAHTVTTWGRDFRVDYLFLGDYIRKTKNILKYQFPIFALTATAVWDPSGKNDMISETTRALNMTRCIHFIGNVKRTNIKFQFSESDIKFNYEQKRRELTIQRIREAIAGKKKTIVYFPFKKTVSDIVFSEDTKDIRDKIASYHASLFQNQKIQNALDFKNGTKTVMCATKAYGMGVDINDIEEVYHHAPTGNLSDYVQEIGRIARDPNIIGIAKIDFSENDFRYIRRLHGLSTIKPYQLLEVLKKLMALYRMSGDQRNMLISASDFSYIFPVSDSDSLDQNLKSALLLISNDLLNKLGFHALIVRPKSLFGKCYISVPKDELKEFKKSHFKHYIQFESENIFLLHADKLWQDFHPNISFPNFKFRLASGKIFQDFNVNVVTKLELVLNSNENDTLTELVCFFKLAHGFIEFMETKHHRLSFADMKKQLPQSWDKEKKERFVETFQTLYASPSQSGSESTYCTVYKSNLAKGENLSFQFLQAGYENVQMKYISLFKQYVRNASLTDYVDPDSSVISVCELLNSLGLANYRRQGGEEPMIFVRINNPAYLYSLLRNKQYENDILKGIYEKQAYAERVFTYFFTTPMTNEERWDFIESYFLGVPEEKLLQSHF